MNRGRVCTDAEKLHKMLQPAPKFLIARPRQLVRHGELNYFSINTNSRKPRYFWLFNDCLLVTKRLGPQRFMLQIVIHFSPGMKVVTMPDSASYEFRLLIPDKGTIAKAKQRRVVMWGKNREHKELWLHDIKHCLWRSTGMVGPDPSLSPQQQQTSDEEVRHMMKEVSIKDRRLSSDPPRSPQHHQQQQQQQQQHGGRSPSGSRRSPQQENDSGEDEYYEQYSDEGEGDEEQWNSPSGSGAKTDPLISFEDMFAHTASEPYAAQRAGYQAQHVPAAVALAPISGYSQQQQQPTYGGAYPGYSPQQGDAYGHYGQPPAGGASPSSPSAHYADPYLRGMAGQQQAYMHMGNLSAYGYAPTTATAGASSQQYSPYAHPATGVPAAAAAAYYGDLYGNPQSLYGQQAAYGGQYGGGGGAGASPASSAVPVAGDDLYARNELLEASKVVEDLAVDLALSRRTTSEQQQQQQHLPHTAPAAFVDISDSLFDGAQFIARACTVLLTAAARAQSERGTADATQTGSHYHADPQWAEGLISAARFVVASIGHLVSTTKRYIASEGAIGDEPLAASAGSVGVSTVQLLSAFRARHSGAGADYGLEEAGKAIASATQKLVEDAKAATTKLGTITPSSSSPAIVVDNSSSTSPTPAKYNLTKRQVNEIEAQERILRLEKEAEAARTELMRLRQAEYASTTTK